jgi:hypothetical protein
MISFTTRGRVFNTEWIWFGTPVDVSGVDEVAILSYETRSYPGFRRKSGITRTIDLTQNEEVLWENMREKFVRKQIERGVRAGIQVSVGSIADFMPLYDSLHAAKGFVPGSVADAAKVGEILIARRGTQVLSGGLFITDGVYVRAYALASARFSDVPAKEREIIGYASRMLIWEALQKYKKQGCHTFDMGGISENDGSLTEYKRAFGGSDQEYSFYRKTYNPWLQILRKLRKLL